MYEFFVGKTFKLSTPKTILITEFIEKLEKKALLLIIYSNTKSLFWTQKIMRKLQIRHFFIFFKFSHSIFEIETFKRSTQISNTQFSMKLYFSYPRGPEYKGKIM
jgi:hypothetical protein